MNYKKIMILTVINNIKIYVSMIFLPFAIFSLVLLGILYLVGKILNIKRIVNFVEDRKQRQWVEHSMIVMCLLFGVSIISLSLWNHYKVDNEKQADLNNFFVAMKEDKVKESEDINADIAILDTNAHTNKNYLAVIEITKIKLLQGIIVSNSHDAAIDKNVSYLSNTDLPDINGGNFTLAAHSGNANISYFNDIDILKDGDTITVYYNSYKYTYKIYKNYVVDQNELSVLDREKDKTIVTLITCKKGDNKKRVIIKAKLVAQDPYVYNQ